MPRFLIAILALFLLTTAGCGVATPYGRMRLRDWEYVGRLPGDQQALAGMVYAREFRERQDGACHTPHGRMSTRNWQYVQSLPVEQQAITGPIYAEEFKNRVILDE
jgi:hypothetical protein